MGFFVCVFSLLRHIWVGTSSQSGVDRMLLSHWLPHWRYWQDFWGEMRVRAKRSMNLLRGPQGLWRDHVASSNAPLAVPGAGILGKGDGQIAPIGAFWLYALPIAPSAATEAASTNDGERRPPWVPPLLFPSPHMSENRTAWPTEGKRRRPCFHRSLVPFNDIGQEVQCREQGWRNLLRKDADKEILWGNLSPSSFKFMLFICSAKGEACWPSFPPKYIS